MRQTATKRKYKMIHIGNRERLWGNAVVMHESRGEDNIKTNDR